MTYNKSKRGTIMKKDYTKALLVLGLHQYDYDQLRKAYRQQAKATHPDMGGDPAEFKLVQDAYDLLKDIGNDAAAYTGINKSQFAYMLFGSTINIDKEKVTQRYDELSTEALTDQAFGALARYHMYMQEKYEKQLTTFILADNVFKGIQNQN